MEEACVYTLFNGSALYIGKALLQRKGAKLGVPSRVMEHLTSVLRKGAQASRTVRAVLLRQQPASAICFLPVKRRASDWIRASETVAIRTLRPASNFGHCRPRRDDKPCNRRSRPPPRFRQRGFFAFVGAAFGHLLTAWTRQSFREAYRRKQQSIYASRGMQGPLYIYAEGCGSLLALWACSKHAAVDARRLLARKSVAPAILRLARLISWVHGYVRQRNGFAQVDKLLHRFNLPGRQLHWFKCPSPDAKQRLQQAIKAAAVSEARQHGQVLYTWVMQRVRFSSCTAPRFSDRRNAVQMAKQISAATVWRSGLFEVKHWRRGEEVKRLPGNWAIMDREAPRIFRTRPVKHG